MKKVLFVANVAKEHILKFHLPTIKKFKDEGWRVDVACAGEDKVPYCDNQYVASWKRSPYTFDTLKGIYELKNIINTKKYDIVFCHTAVGGLIARLAANRARSKGTKVVYCAHGLHFFKGAPLINWFVYYPIEKLLTYYTDLFLAVNDEDYNLAKEKFNKNMLIKLVPEVGVDFSRLSIEDPNHIRELYRKELRIPQNARVLIYVAELTDNKNQSMLIDMLKRLSEKLENVFLVLVGPDHNNGKIQRYAKLVGVDQNVKFLGWRSDIGELMVSSDIYVASSIREGFGITLVEAMYCGLPVIATKNRGHVTFIKDGENGLIVNINDVEKMAEYVEKIIFDEKLRKRITGIDVSRYDSNKIAGILFQVLTQQ